MSLPARAKSNSKLRQSRRRHGRATRRLRPLSPRPGPLEDWTAVIAVPPGNAIGLPGGGFGGRGRSREEQLSFRVVLSWDCPGSGAARPLLRRLPARRIALQVAEQVAQLLILQGIKDLLRHQ